MGQLEDARESAVRLRTITSVVVPDDSYLRNAEDRELFLSELALDMSQSRRLASEPRTTFRDQPLGWALFENKTRLWKVGRVDRTS
jgi:hypothetical protein